MTDRTISSETPTMARPRVKRWIETARTVAIGAIKVGQRHRRDLGDIDALAESINKNGLLHPIVVTEDHRLIAGGRRLAACKRLGWSDVPVTTIRLKDIARGEFAENAIRKDFLPSEIDAIRRTLEPAERAAATSRKVSGRSSDQAGETRDRIGAFAGVSGRTVEKIAAIVAAAEARPEFAPLVEEMDRTGRVDGIYRRLKVARQAAQIRREPSPLPNRGPYRVIVVDPPWPYYVRTEDPSHRGATPYPQMSMAQICAMRVGDIAHRDCVLWLWTTNAHMQHSYEVLNSWGFESKTILTWAKDRMGVGDWLRGQTEHCHLAVRGRPTVVLTNQTTLLTAPVRAHSQKPKEFYDLVEALCPAPRYADLFSRYRHNAQWDCHGDEVPRGGTAGGRRIR